MVSWIFMLAQADAPVAPTTEGPPGFMKWAPFVLILVVFYFILFRPRSKEQKHRRQMLSSMKKNDRVMTIGGVVGTVVQVRDDEVVVKVDESANVKLTFIRGSIQKILSSDGA